MSSSSPDPQETTHKAKVISTVTHYTLVPVPGASGGAKSKTKPKTKKETKTKEFTYTFEASLSNYLDFLKLILEKHGEERYNITAKMLYSMKVQLAGIKKTEALDVDTLEEFNELVKDDIIAKKTLKLTVFVDMADIEKRWRKKKGANDGSDDEDVNGDDPGLYMDGLSELDRSLARFRGILEKKYQNDHNAGYTYIDPDTGTSHPLTPQMMKEWSRAMHDGQATQEAPPDHLNMFNPANRKRALHPSRIAAGANQPQGATSDIGHLASILTTVFGAQANPRQQQPQTPPKHTQDVGASTPVFPTPSKLPRFLDHAANTLGITSAPDFESPMRRNGFGPDILHLVDDQELTEMGMRKGDVIRLKAGAQSWWNGPEAKKRTHSEIDNQGSTPDPLATPPSKKVAFERRFTEGGGERFWGPRIVAGQGEKNIWYRCPVRKEFVPVPPGYRATGENEMPEAEDGEKEMDLLKPPTSQEGEGEAVDNDARLLLGLSYSAAA
ncbi:hypothetical protein DFH08DRAFT_803820 [Mycena albidolilacea]|uniref:Uncharacterized protein n=1 Tax=Mycena albidolilacea TaxID=1033008 RepID=A0AAD7ADV6_9AGAR|nr:hypothetical protein DFH08DRAFT_803820 [Mycena albidolilacea]